MKKFKKSVLPSLLAPWAQWILRAILKTCRITIQGSSGLINEAEKGPCLLVLWHQYLAPLAYFLEKCAPQFTYAPVISNSRDGEILARFLRRYPQCSPIRAAHNARHKVLKAIMSIFSQPRTIVVITPDGPRGPSLKAKPGAAAAAAQSGASVIPLSWEADRYWTLKTWDKMRIPKPFAKIVVHFGEPTHAPDTNKIEALLKNE